VACAANQSEADKRSKSEIPPAKAHVAKVTGKNENSYFLVCGSPRPQLSI
jgi:hypothetical protein